MSVCNKEDITLILLRLEYSSVFSGFLECLRCRIEPVINDCDIIVVRAVLFCLWEVKIENVRNARTRTHTKSFISK